MKPALAATEFETFLARHALDRTRLTPEQGVQAMLAFYRDERAEGCRFESDGDMLLYQWGTYDWGHSEFFELNITRQLCRDGSGEDEDIWQLGLTFRFSPTPPLRALQRGNRWCRNLGQLEEFERFLQASEALHAVATVVATTVDLRHECAG